MTILSILFSSVAHAGLDGAARTSIDAYVAGAKGGAKAMTTIVSGIATEAKARIAAIEKILPTEIVDLDGSNVRMSRMKSDLDEASRLVEEMKLDVYHETEWVKKMRAEVQTYCCAMLPVGNGKQSKGIYTKLNKSGGGDPSRYNQNTKGLGAGRGKGKAPGPPIIRGGPGR